MSNGLFANLTPLEEHFAPTVPGPEERLTISPSLVRALTQLSDRDREVLALRFGGDLTGPEIAMLLGLTLANVQQILSRSLRRMRAQMDESAAAAAQHRRQT